MRTTLEQVTQEALALSTQERSTLTRALIQSLEDEPAEDSTEVEQAWLREIAHRIGEIKSGRVQGIPAEEVFSKLRAKYG